jgi:hypothetical protein
MKHPSNTDASNSLIRVSSVFHRWLDQRRPAFPPSLARLIRIAWAGSLLTLGGAAPHGKTIDGPLRAKLWMAWFGIVVLGIGLLFAVMLGAWAVRRRARHRTAASRAISSHTAPTDDHRTKPQRDRP